MYVQTTEGEVKYFFKHEAPVWKRNGARTKKGLAASGVTVCILSFQGRVHVGIARCSATDKYVKSHGRHIALARALEHINPTVRQRVWDEYLARGSEEVAIRDVLKLARAATQAARQLETMARSMQDEGLKVRGNGNGHQHSGANDLWDPPETAVVDAGVPPRALDGPVVTAPADGPIPEPIPEFPQVGDEPPPF